MISTKFIYRIIIVLIILAGILILLPLPSQAEVGFQYRPGSWGEPHALFYQQFYKTEGLSLKPQPIFQSQRNQLNWEYKIDPLENVVVYEVMAFTNEPVFRDSLQLNTFIRMQNQQALRTAWRESVEKSKTEIAGEEGREGFIPDIELPVAMPSIVESIFGPGEPRLNISGQQRISFEGQSTTYPDRTNTGYGATSSFNPKMEQQLTVRLDGTIGDKMHILVDHNSQAQMDNKNKIRLRYEGYEDDIIQEIEAGDTQLSLGGGLVSASFPSQGLFGIKARAKLGGIDVTMIASKEEGKFTSARFTGTGSQDSTAVWDYQFEKRRFFWIDDPNELLFFDQNTGEFRINETLLPTGNFVVFIDDNNIQDDLDSDKVGYAIAKNAQSAADSVFQRHWKPLTRDEDYFIDFNQGFLRFDRPVSDRTTIGISYTTRDSTVGFVDANSDTILLRLIKPAEMDTNSVCWDYEFRHVYNLGYNFDRDADFQIIVNRYQTTDIQGEFDYNANTGNTYLYDLGMDLNNNGFIDDRWLDFIPGYLWIPHHPPGRNPPSTVYPFELDALDVENEVIYHKREDQLRPEQGDKQYYISIITQKPQKQIKLNNIGIIEGSVRVRVNGESLTEGQDFTVNYDFGQVTLNRVLGPNDQLEIDYEYSGLGGFALQQKTLLGLRAEYDYNDNTTFGTTWVYEGEKAIDERPKVGEEASRILIGGVDSNFSFEPPLLTRIVDAIPLIDTDAKSSVSLTAEGAMSIPNPNIKGDAYIDDMEGVVQSNSIGIEWTGWHYTSLPDTGEASPTALAPEHMGQLKWFNPQYDSRSPRFSDIFGEDNLDQNPTDDYQRVLQMHFTPYDSLTPGWSEMPEDSLEKSWAGVLKCINPNGYDFSRQRFLEVWLYSEYEDPNAKTLKPGTLKIDIGDISEDTIRRLRWGRDSNQPDLIYTPNGDSLPEPETEAGAISNTQDRTQYRAEDDVGIDRVPGDDESQGDCTEQPCDDGNDDYPSNDAIRDRDRNEININGTEGNGRLDSEDLDQDGNLDTRNNYIQVSIDLGQTGLDSTGYYVDGTFHEDSNGRGAWRKYQIPIRDASVDTINSMNWTLVRYARLWLTGFETPEDHIVKVYSMEVTGNRWEPEGITTFDRQECMIDSTYLKPVFNVSAKNTRENSATYKKPPNVPTRPSTTGEEEREQTLVLEYENLAPGYSMHSTQYFTSEVNFLDYENVKFWTAVPIDYSPVNYMIDETTPPDIFIRFGADSLNYYEYSVPLADTVHYESRESIKWYNIEIPLGDLTQVKLDRDNDSTWINIDRIYPDSSTYLAKTPFRIRGRPTLQRVKIITVGVRNTARCDQGLPLRGEVWVNELRLTDVKRDIGHKGVLRANIRFADLGSFTFNYSRETSDYIPNTKSSRRDTETENISLSGNLDAHKFLPKDWGFSIPLRASYDKSRRTPVYNTGSDVRLSGEAQREFETTSNTRRASVSFSKSGSSKNPLIKLLLENLSLSADYSKTQQRGLTSRDTTTTLSGKMDYNLQFGQKRLNIYKGFFISPIPNNITLSTSYSERESKFWKLVSGTFKPDSTQTRQGSSSVSMRFTPIPNLTGSFRMDEDRSLTDEDKIYQTEEDDKVFGLFTLFGQNLGRVNNHSKKLDGNYSLNFFDIISPKINGSVTYSERWRTQIGGLNANPEATGTGTGDVNRTLSYGADASVQPDKVISNTFGLVGKVLSVGKVFTKLGGGDDDEEEDSAPDGESEPRSRQRPGVSPDQQSPDQSEPQPQPGDGDEQKDQEAPPERQRPPSPGDSPVVMPDKDRAPNQIEREALEQEQRRPDRDRDRRDRASRDSDDGGDGIFKKIGGVFSGITKSLGSISARYNWKQNIGYKDIPRDRVPDYSFQFGLEDAVPDTGGVELSPQRDDINEDYSLSSRLGISRNLDFDIRYTLSTGEQKSGGASSTVFREKRDETFPSVSGNLRSVEKLPLLNKILNSASLNSSFKRTTRENGETDITTNEYQPTDEATTVDFSPLISLNMDWKMGFKLNLSSNYSETENTTNINTGGTTNLSNKMSVDARFEYTLKSKRGGRYIPIIGKINSDVKISMNASYTEEDSWRGLPPGWEELETAVQDEYLRSSTKSYSVRPSLSYTFSRAVTGGLQGEYSIYRDSIDKNRNRNTVTLSVWTLLKF